ncbi:hypothetical protein [Pseudoalteromonas sp. BDTF-M6]|uniref:hypothetical protein n=1 Tax=Pseudoalteromonas sp. BDTF-M6 TaxID=2796132 RepID=UPI001BB00857|nr:hypothetical protein [Pseudoalteromonas sp. BDTF-M6]MBS3797355.1 hypothetical protein [Pseudoalteromonas sp. BDTF-M6]
MLTPNNNTLIVPCEPNDYTAQQSFMLTPSTSQRWITQLSESGESLGGPNNDDFNVNFTNNPSDPSLEKLQEARFVVHIEDPDWEFFGNGVEYVKNNSNCNYNVDSQLSDDKKQLTIVLRQVEPTVNYAGSDNSPLDKVIEVTPSPSAQPLTIGFRYTAKQLSSGRYYMSQDPRIIVERPKEQ